MRLLTGRDFTGQQTLDCLEAVISPDRFPDSSTFFSGTPVGPDMDIALLKNGQLDGVTKWTWILWPPALIPPIVTRFASPPK